LNLDFQNVRTANHFPAEEEAPDTTGSVGGTVRAGYSSSSYTSSGTTSYTSYGLGVQYRISEQQGHNAFTRLRLDHNDGGFGHFRRTVATLGLDFRLTSVLNARLYYDYTRYHDTGNESRNYSSNRFNGEIRVRF